MAHVLYSTYCNVTIVLFKFPPSKSLSLSYDIHINIYINLCIKIDQWISIHIYTNNMTQCLFGQFVLIKTITERKKHSTINYFAHAIIIKKHQSGDIFPLINEFSFIRYDIKKRSFKEYYFVNCSKWKHYFFLIKI